MRGLEPPRLSALAPKTSVSTISPHPHNYLETNLRFFSTRRAKNAIFALALFSLGSEKDAWVFY